MKKVVIIQQIIPEYRVPFFNLLREALAKENVELSLIHSNADTSSNTSPISWATVIHNRKLNLGLMQLIWQPVMQYLKGKDMVVVEKSNKLLLNYYLILTRLFSKRKLAFWGHGRNMQVEPNSGQNKFAVLTLKYCHWWFAYTQGVKDFLIKHKYPADRITNVQNAIDTRVLQEGIQKITEAEMAKLKQEMGIKGNKVAIFCGRMYPEKRIDFILESCYIIKKSIPDFEMIFIGSGQDAPMVQEAASVHKWIYYVGPKSGAERIKYFKIAQVQLMPGLVGLGVLDSFALETPIITTNYKYHSPEVEYIQDGKNGIIAENDLDIYSQRVVETLSNNKYQQLIEGCRLSAQKYTIETMVNNFKSGILACMASS